MKQLHSISDLRHYRHAIAGRSLGFVPTMGALHDGHLSLVRQALSETDHCIVSIFVNPTQFAPNEDFSAYPRPLDMDLALLHRLGVDAVFCPDSALIYPEGPEQGTKIQVPGLGQLLEGQTRPHFFDGVCQVVLRLFNLVQPQRAYFGEKDFQQLAIIRRMVRDLFLDIQIVGCPIVREASGLAMSSRNVYLSAEDRQAAGRIYHALSTACHDDEGKPAEQVLKPIQHAICADNPPLTPIVPDYLCLCDSETLLPVTVLARGNRLLFAGYLGKTRLIDNIEV